MNPLGKDILEIKKSVKHLEKQIRGSNFLVTGGAGFLGSWMCDALLSMGAKVTCVDNLSSGSEINLKDFENNSNFTFFRQDISGFVPKEKFDYIIHMASIASPPLYQKKSIETLDSGVIGTRNMLELAVKFKVRAFLFTSTSEIYGNPPKDEIPTRETYYGFVNSYGPRSMYDEGKRCAEAYCYSFWKRYKVPVRIARIFNTYGPRLDIKNTASYGRALIKFVYHALRNEPIKMYNRGKPTRSFCYVTDQIIGLIKLLLTPNIDGEIVNIGSEKEISIKELVSIIVNLTNSSSSLEYSKPDYDITDDPLRRKPDITKARKLLKWGPRVNLEEGLRRTIGWIKSQ